MRLNIVHPGADELHYEIRDIAEFGQKIASTSIEVIWENIGDPVAKGEKPPEWVKDIVASAVKKDESYAYSPTKGLLSTRKFLADKRTKETGNKLSPDDIIFFNGLGDAITKIYTWLNPIARVLGPCPAYPTHSAVEAAHGRSFHLTYELDSDNDWLPNMADVRSKVKFNPNIAALLIINPDNPTGIVYPKEILQEFVDIAREFDLFLIADEIYANLTFADVQYISLASLTGDIPTIIMRGLSKEVPWPGSRCGWIECYDKDKDSAFSRYIRTVLEAKMIEVCSTTLPQLVLPEILSYPEYSQYLAKRTAHYEERAEQLYQTILKLKGVHFIKPHSTFYATIFVDSDVLERSAGRLKPQNLEAGDILSKAMQANPDMPIDKQFCYKLLASTGLCVVPLSGFNTNTLGFRMTLLEQDDNQFQQILDILISIFE